VLVLEFSRVNWDICRAVFSNSSCWVPNWWCCWISSWWLSRILREHN
jgi:hypothetical protein